MVESNEPDDFCLLCGQGLRWVEQSGRGHNRRPTLAPLRLWMTTGPVGNVRCDKRTQGGAHVPKMDTEALERWLMT